MIPKRLNPTVAAFVAVLLALAYGCSSQKNDNLDTAEQAPPPPATSNDSTRTLQLPRFFSATSGGSPRLAQYPATVPSDSYEAVVT